MNRKNLNLSFSLFYEQGTTRTDTLSALGTMVAIRAWRSVNTAKATVITQSPLSAKNASRPATWATNASCTTLKQTAIN